MNESVRFFSEVLKLGGIEMTNRITSIIHTPPAKSLHQLHLKILRYPGQNLDGLVHHSDQCVQDAYRHKWGISHRR